MSTRIVTWWRRAREPSDQPVYVDPVSTGPLQSASISSRSPEGGMFCTQCGHKNPEGAHFCANCGAALAAAADDSTTTISLAAQDLEAEVEEEVAAPVEELREGTAMLVVRRGPNAGSRFLLDKELITAGRHPESDIFLDDITVSRRHAEIRRRSEERRVGKECRSRWSPYH